MNLDFTRLALTILCVLALGAVGVQAQTLTIALHEEPTAIDPHYQSFTPNVQLAATLFDALVRKNRMAEPEPALAESWQVDGNVWTFHLRRGVTFSDGSPLTAADVVFSFDRVYTIPYSPSSYALYLNQVQAVKALDDYTIQVTTEGPAPVLLANLAMIPILSQRAAQQASQSKTDQAVLDPSALVGTGPFQLVHWQRGQELVIKRNPHYWGTAPAWEQVVFKLIPDGAQRVEALLQDEVDVIEAPPVDEIPHLEKMPTVFVQKVPSTRLMYVGLNQSMSVPSGMAGTLGKNPLTDRRVRAALSLAIDRDYLARNTMNGAAQAAGNLLSYPGFGTSERFGQAPAVDLTLARQLLAEAGYANGFTLSLGASVGGDRNDDRVAQAIADMWSKIGIQVQVELLAPAQFFRQRDNYAFSSYLSGWTVVTGEISHPLLALAVTPDHGLGYGITNWSHYRNSQLDRLVIQATQTLDNNLREKLLQQAAEELLLDYGLLPVLFELSTWAMNQRVRYAGRVDQYTLPQDIHPL